MTITEIANISELLYLGDCFGEFAEQYDLQALLEEFVDALDEAAGPGVHVTHGGTVYADVDEAARARDIDWRELAGSIDVDAIAGRHERG